MIAQMRPNAPKCAQKSQQPNLVIYGIDLSLNQQPNPVT